MSLSEDIKIQAEDYLDGKLLHNAQNAFEQLLKENQELAEYVSLNQEMRLQYADEDWSFVDKSSDVSGLENYLKSEEAKEIKSTIKEVNNAYTKETSSNKKPYFYYFAIAASIVVLMGWFMFSSSPTNLEIYSEYNDWSNLPSLTTRGDSDNILLVQGEKAFLNKDYNKAETYFEEFLMTSADGKGNALLYYGISNIELNNHEKALDAFNQLISSESLDSSKGYWYKALTYLKMDDKANAITELNSIVMSASNYNYNQAKDLLEKLD